MLRLIGDAHALWTQPAERQRAVDALFSGDPERRDVATARIDRAVAEALAALGLPRGPIRRVEFGPFGFVWAGRKHPDCRLFINEQVLSPLSPRDRRDATFRTWAHESLHARRPYTRDFADEWARTPGYEEGLIETLTRIVVVEKAGLDPPLTSYTFYVRAYQHLARVLGVDIESLARALWHHPAGAVRQGVLDVIRPAIERRSGTTLTVRGRLMLGAKVDAIFASSRVDAVGDADEIKRLWEDVFG